jgi:predicted phage terminase large subunit-like protein
MSDADRRKNKLVCAAADWAITKQQASNRTSLTVGGTCLDNLLHFVDQRVGKWDSLEIVEKVFQLQLDHRPDIFWVESGQIWASLKPMFQKEMLAREIFINFVERAPIKDKASRGRSLQKRMRAGHTRWDTQTTWFEGMKEEMLRFTEHAEATLDDQFDSAALLSLGFEDMALIGEEDFQDEEEAELLRTDPRTTGGRSEVTGY